MKTEPDTIPPESAIFGVETQSISDIISNLRTTFRSSDFNRAEEELVAREEALRREISRLKEQNRFVIESHELVRLKNVELEDELAAEEKEKERLSSEVSELRRKVDSLENDVFVLRLRNSDVKSSPVRPIVILDSDDDCPVEAKSPKKESSPWCYKVRQTEQYYSISPRERGNGNYSNPGDRTVPDDNVNQETKAPPRIEHLDSPAKHDSHVKRQFSSSNESNTIPKKTPPPVSKRARGTSGPATRSPRTQDYELFWSRLTASEGTSTETLCDRSDT